MNESALSKWINRLLFLCNLVVLGAAAYFVFTRGWVSGAGGWNAVELVTAVLAAVSLLITVLGIFIAILAIWGYDRIKRDARTQAQNSATTYLNETIPGMVANEIEAQLGDHDYGQAAAAKEGENVKSP